VSRAAGERCGVGRGVLAVGSAWTGFRDDWRVPFPGECLAAPRAGAPQRSCRSTAPKKHRGEDRPLGWETLRADETLTTTRVFGFHWGMLQANFIGSPSMEVAAQQQPSLTNSYWPHTQHSPVRAHPMDRSQGRNGTRRAPCSAPGSFVPAASQAAFKALASTLRPGSCRKQTSRPRQAPSILLPARPRG